MDDTKTQAKQITDRINELQFNLSKSYSQSDPGAMMDRRLMRKEKEKLEGLLANLTEKKKD